MSQPSAQPPVQRSEAQAEASRLIGAKSAGPVTEGGKARSADNARKHGLLPIPNKPDFDIDMADVEMAMNRQRRRRMEAIERKKKR